MSKFVEIANFLEQIKDKIGDSNCVELLTVVSNIYEEYREYTRVYGEEHELLSINNMLKMQVEELKSKVNSLEAKKAEFEAEYYFLKL